MDVLPIEPWRCEALSLEDFDRMSLGLIKLLEHLATSFGRKNEEGEQYELETQRWQEFHDSILPGDKLWLMTEPASHPEVTHGSASLVITRHGQLVTRFQLYQSLAQMSGD